MLFPPWACQETSSSALQARYGVFASPGEKDLAWRLFFGGKCARVLSAGEDNGARLLAEAGKAVGASRVRQSTRKAYESGLPWVWPRFIGYITEDGSTTSSGQVSPSFWGLHGVSASGLVDILVQSPSFWGLHGVSASGLVDILVQFQSFLVMEGLSPAKIKNQWLKTYDRFASPGSGINSLVVSDLVWTHPWVSASRSMPRVVRSESLNQQLDSSGRQQLAAGFAVLWEVRQLHLRGNRDSPEARVYALCYIGIALMFNFGWRPGQVVWTGNASHLAQANAGVPSDKWRDAQGR